MPTIELISDFATTMAFVQKLAEYIYALFVEILHAYKIEKIELRYDKLNSSNLCLRA